MASTADYGGQMACGLVFIKKWVDDNRPLVEKLIEAFGKAGEQIKSHDEALRFATEVNSIIFKERSAEEWYNAFKSYPLQDDDGNEVQIGGSRTFSLADAASYVGISGGSDKYKTVYTMFGDIWSQAYPEVVPSYPSYEEATDFSFLKAVYARNKKTGTEGSVSKVDYTTSTKDAVIGDASFAIEFKTGSSEISPSSYKILDDIVKRLSVVDGFVEISGHTDNTGTPLSNTTLSEQRANSVKEYLISKNPELQEAGKMTSKGYGQSKPLNPSEDQNNADVRARNRRVEIKLYRAKS